MSKTKTSMKGSTASTVEKPCVELKAKGFYDDKYAIRYNGSLRCNYDKKDWEAIPVELHIGEIAGFKLRYLHTRIETPIIWFE